MTTKRYEPGNAMAIVRGPGRRAHRLRPRSLASVLMAALLIAGLLTGCKSPAAGGSTTITIGGDFPLSGLEASYGPLYQNAADLAAQVVNSQHLFDGTIKMAYADDQGLPAPAVTAAHQLINVNHAQVLLVGQSAPSLAVAPVGARSKVLMINGGGGSPQLQGLNDYFFNDIPLGPQTAPPMAEYVTKELGHKRWAIIYTTESVGEGLLGILKKAVPSYGGQIVSQVGIDPTTSSFTAQIAQIAKAKPDVLYLASTVGDIYPTILNQVHAAQMRVQIATFTGYDIPAVLANKYSDGNLCISQSQDMTASTNPATATFLSEWNKKHKTAPSSLQINYYNAVLLVAQAAANLQKENKDVNGTNLAQELHNSQFAVAGGTVAFTPQGTLKSPALDIVQIGPKGSEKVIKQVKGSS